jgi:hypothetical protein
MALPLIPIINLVATVLPLIKKKKETPVMKSYILNRLAEPSSWRGLFALLTAAGISIAPDQQTAIVSLGLAAIGFVGTFFPDMKK